MPSKPLLYVLGFFVLVVALFPRLGLVLLVLNFSFILVLHLARMWSAALPLKPVPSRARKPHYQPFVSIHVPAHNEPPVLLKQTLKALSVIRYDNYEVLVIDNNTSDPNLWKPIEAYCQELGPRFKFFHKENMTGFKAGALNFIRQFINTQAEYVAVVDADYKVHPSFLAEAMNTFSDATIGLVQFPQAYQNVSSKNKGIAFEYDHFFAVYMNMGNYYNCVPSTGTVTVLRVTALNSIGLFNEGCITEDAEIGYRFIKAGFTGVYVHKVVGEGMMPHDLAAFKAQRRRWVFGNSQILFHNIKNILFGTTFSLSQKFGFVTQMTAWCSGMFIPTISLVVLSFLYFFGLRSSLNQLLLSVACFNILTIFLLETLGFIIGFWRMHMPYQSIISAITTHLGLTWVFSTAWIEAMLTKNIPFVRTNKFLSPNLPRLFRHAAVELLLACVLTVIASIFILDQHYFLGFSSIVCSLSFWSIIFIAYQMRSTKETTTILNHRLERLFQ